MAQRLQQKRSSIPGRRPDNSYLNPGELAINTNASDPGLFFEGHDGSVIKAGPTAMGSEAPVTEVGYGNGEAWFNTSDRILKHYQASSEEWIATLAPLYGGSEHLVFVGTEFHDSSDDISNDGSARPFASINRACIEIARRSILLGRSDYPTQAKYTIVLLPGANIARNEPGLTKDEFIQTVGALNKDHQLTLDELRSFNPVEGGIPLPRGTTIVGLDAFKCNIHPSYYPEWSREAYENDEVDLAPRTAIFHTSGDALINRVTFRDKVKELSVVAIEGESKDAVAVFRTLQPHGLRSFVLNAEGNEVTSGDLVNLKYPDLVSRTNAGTPSLEEGKYWAEPLTEDTFRIRSTETLEAAYRGFLPSSPVPGSVPNEFVNFTVELKTHHRLSALKFASEKVLNEYYSKVQQAFTNLNFGGVIDDSEVNRAEVDLVIPRLDKPTPAVDDSTHHAPSFIGCYLKSNYGLCGVNADGALIGGAKEFYCETFSYHSFQNDPDVYEVFYDQHWIALKEATWRGLGIQEIDVTDEMALQYMIDSVQIENIRYYYRSSYDIAGKSDSSSGLTDLDSDTRHYSIISSHDAAVDALDQKCIGAAVGFWSLNGGRLLVDNPTFTMGTETLRAEGFSGIGTMGGATESHKGFEVAGIRRPSVVPAIEVKDQTNHKFIYLGASIASATSAYIKFTEPVNTRNLLPYSLREGSVIWVKSLATGERHKATIAADGLSSDGLTLFLDSLDNEIEALDVDSLSLPYIRRFIDPRPPSDRNYYLQVANTSESHEPPDSGMVLRYAENQGSNVITLLEPGRQLDPGNNGGWNHIFVVHQSLSREDGENPNTQQPWFQQPDRSENYYVSLKLNDSFGPWDEEHNESRGAAVTYSNRTWMAEFADVTELDLVPSEEKSEWALAKRTLVLQNVEEAYIPESYTRAADPYKNEYGPGAKYARGLRCPDETYDDKSVVDYDDGTENFGITFGNVVSSAIIDPTESHSRIAIDRFLTMLGYNGATIDLLLDPQLWNKRNLPIAQFPALDGEGYALSVGNWPVEFNAPSVINATNVVWEQPGTQSPSKGLAIYRKSTLSSQLRFDAMRSTAWGGYAAVEGRSNNGETLPLDVDFKRNTNNVF